jgi:peptidoglycan/LPS O-acetylase OafA/YrhL
MMNAVIRVEADQMNQRDARISLHIPELDGFRALAIWLVLNMHFGVYLRFAPWYNVITTAGWIGVPLFFILSGMLLALPFSSAAFSGRPPPSISHFYQRRALRILPLFYLSMVIFIAVFLGNSSPLPRGWEIARHVLFVHNYQAEFSHINRPYWSLANEVQFYVFLPIIGLSLFALLRTRRHRAALWLLAGLWTTSIVYRVVINLSPEIFRTFGYTSLFYMSTIGNFDSFTAGIFCALVYSHARGSREGILSRRVAYALLPMGAILVYLLMAAYQIVSRRLAGDLTDPAIQDWFFPAVYFTLLPLAWMICILATLSLPRSLWARFMGWRPVVFISTISYSLYIWHMAVKELTVWLLARLTLARPTRTAAQLVVESLGALSVATLSYYMIERPFLRLKPRGS